MWVKLQAVKHQPPTRQQNQRHFTFNTITHKSLKLKTKDPQKIKASCINFIKLCIWESEQMIHLLSRSESQNIRCAIEYGSSSQQQNRDQSSVWQWEIDIYHLFLSFFVSVWFYFFILGIQRIRSTWCKCQLRNQSRKNEKYKQLQLSKCLLNHAFCLVDPIWRY